MKSFNLLIIILSSLLFSSCKKNRTPEPEKQTLPPQVKSIASQLYGQVNFSYDNSGRLNTIDYPHYGNFFPKAEKFTYNSVGNVAKIISSTDSTVYNYNNSGQIVLSEYYQDWKMPAPPLTRRLEYIYNLNGTIASIYTRSYRIINENEDNNNIKYEYDSNGLLKRYNYTQFLYPSTETIEIEGYNDEMNINPFILERFTGDLFLYWGQGIFASVKKFPKVIKIYYKGELWSTTTYNFSVTNKRVNKIEIEQTDTYSNGTYKTSHTFTY